MFGETFLIHNINERWISFLPIFFKIFNKTPLLEDTLIKNSPLRTDFIGGKGLWLALTKAIISVTSSFFDLLLFKPIELSECKYKEPISFYFL